VRQEIVGDVLSLTHGGNGLLQISRVPEDDCSDEEVEARDTVQLVFVGAIANFTQTVDEDGARQTNQWLAATAMSSVRLRNVAQMDEAAVVWRFHSVRDIR
jgi:hypothetical protein